MSFEDVFVIGIGFDIVGAYLLAKGLLLSPLEVLNLSSTYYGFNAGQIVASVSDKISSEVGVVSLIVGFLCQLVGYALNLAITATSLGSPARGGVAVLLAFATVLCVLLAHRVLVWPRQRRLLIDIARYDDSGNRQELANGFHLMVFGQALSKPALEGESQSAYARRVWRVTAITEDEPPG